MAIVEENVDFSPGGDAQMPPLTLGIDEAGRGCVAGPLVYCAFLSTEADWTFLKNDLGAKDSKAMTADRRSAFCDAVREKYVGRFGWLVHETPATVISNVMMTEVSREGGSLNDVSRDAAVALIRRALLFGAPVRKIYVDALGDCDSYERYLSGIFTAVDEITVREKADDLFPVVSGASIFAKVTRDKAIERIEKDYGIKLGSGYPSDPLTQTYLLNFSDPVFGYPPFIRFSWQTVRTLLDKKQAEGSVAAVKWNPTAAAAAGMITTLFSASKSPTPFAAANIHPAIIPGSSRTQS